MSDADRKTFSSWKFDMIAGIEADDRLLPMERSIAIRILAAVNQDTRVAIISDMTLSDEIPKCDRHRCNDARKRLIATGWLTAEPGSGRRATRYTFLDGNVNRMLDQLLVKREQREERRKTERQTYAQRQRKAASDVVRRDVVASRRGAGYHVRAPRDVVPGTTRTPIDSLPVESRSLRACEPTTSPDHTTPPIPWWLASDEPLVVFPSDLAAMRMMFGNGSYRLGRDRLKLLPKEDWWALAEKLEQRGLTGSDFAEVEDHLAAIEARYGAAPPASDLEDAS